jgi:hypothetical protein
VSTLLKNNANLHTLHCERVSRFSHEFIDDAATRDVFASRIVDATLLSDNSDSFRALRFVERLLECKTVALTSLVVTDLNSMMLMLFKAKLGLKFPKIEVKFHK